MPHLQFTPGANLNPTGRFSNRVSHYVQSRPGYPAELLRFCADRLGLRQSDAIADVGSGTGILSKIFLDNRNIVFGVEPNGPMREAAEQLLGDHPNFHSIDGKAEATTLPASTVRFVVSGQAFHWFDPVASRAEFRRILTPGGWVILIWNERVLGLNDFSDAYEAIIRKFEVDLNAVHHASMTAQDSRTLAEFFAPGICETEKFVNLHELDLAGVEARALSSSYLPLPGQQGCQEMIDALRAAFSKYQTAGRVQFRYDTKVFFGQLG